MLESTGVPTVEDLKARMPSKERLARGPVAMIECFQRIPCDPCYHSCKRGAISKLIDINDIPQVDYEKCNGCGLCISNCPGLAIFVLDQNYDEKYGLIKMPYELLPRPEIGEEVVALNREGQEVCKGKVVEVRDGKIQDKTAIIGVAVPKKFLMEVRNIKVGRSK
ncbi:4Fe-4S ferredoxin [Anoxybacter fermentans]|uniref:4Fe-4S ferredoxin n=1 Tax=Anoxybacter fermentans TaxID=1323375 RepID=A0A3Q9HPC1_9FIRM|nr:4Fe-4S binding protein [Anoxybacter fermentans]AZR72471.1 4Fe-4S ferredoxin [Anoxybacter fermentans]